VTNFVKGNGARMTILAYIDPGSGSLLLQAILAAVIAVPFLFRRTIGDIVHRLRGGSKPDAVPEADGSKPSER
jgi:hypothetical protein